MRSLCLAFALLPLLLSPAIADEVDDVVTAAREETAAGKHEGALDKLRDALDAHPDEPRLLHALGRATHAQALAVLGENNASLGRLALLDAVTWYKRALAAKPDWTDALWGLGPAAVAMGDFESGTDAYRRLAALLPENGEARYQLGYCLAYRGDFEAAVKVFAEAEKLLGPDPRVLMNLGITLTKLERVDEAEACFLRLLRGEADAKRPGSPEAKSGFLWLWRLPSRAARYTRATIAFDSLAKSHPQLIGAHWYKAHAMLEGGDPAGAADAFLEVTRLSPAYAAGWAKAGGALVKARRFEEAAEALSKLLPLDPEGEGPRDLLLSIARGLARADRTEESVEVLTRLEPSFPGDPLLLEARGDFQVKLGRLGPAIADYRLACELDPFADEVAVKAQKAVTAALRAGEKVGGERPEGEPAAESRGEGAIRDFESSEVFVRVNGGAEGFRRAGAFGLRRFGGPGRMANISVTLIPTLDTRMYATLSFRAKGAKGKALLVQAMDCYDEFTIRPGIVRLLHEQVVVLTGEKTLYRLPLAGFKSVVAGRRIPLNRARLRAILFEIGHPLDTGADLAGEVEIDDVALEPGDGRVLTLADFGIDPGETLFLSDGAASPFAPTLSSAEQVAAFRPDPNTYVSPAIFGEEFDETTVHGGGGSYRLTLVREGEASGVLTFNPDRSFDKATAITFWARGTKGGEKVRVTIRDSLDDDLGLTKVASAPRMEKPSWLLEGWFVLSPEWKRFTISRAEFPDVDFRSLLELRFRFGTDEGNPVGTRLFIDDIRWK